MHFIMRDFIFPVAPLHVFRLGHRRKRPVAGGASGGCVPIKAASGNRRKSTTETWMTTSSTTVGPLDDVSNDSTTDLSLQARQNFIENWIFLTLNVATIIPYEIRTKISVDKILSAT